MLLTILLLIKFILYTIFTDISYAKWIVVAIDMLFVFALSFIFVSKKKSFKITSAIIYSLISLIIFIDVVYFSYFNRLPVIRELGHAGVLGGVVGAFLAVFKLRNLLFIIDIPISLYIYFKREAIFKHINKKIIPTIGLLTSVFVIIFNFSTAKKIYHMALFPYHAIDIAGGEKNIVEAADNNIADAGNLISSNEYTGVAKGKNLIVIQVESLNNFVIGREYNGEEITPNLNKLIEDNESIYASDYFEMLGAGNTSDAEFVTLHSLYPSMKNPSYEVYLDSYLYGLPKILKDHGYDNAAFHGYKRDFWIRDRAYPHIGFDKFFAEDNYELDEIIGMGLSDMSFFEQSMPRIMELKEPFFAFMITLSNHVPYDLPEELKEIDILPEDEGSFYGNYINTVRYTDSAIGKFIDNLKANELYDNTIIAIYGDHHGISAGLNPRDVPGVEELIGEKFDFDTMLNVPLIMHVPGLSENIKIDDVRSQIDFLPTILNLYGIDSSNLVLFGHDILSEDNPAIIYPQSYMLKGSFIDDDYIYNILRDGIFENGILKDRHTKKRMDPSSQKDKYIKAINEIETCKKILENDMIEELMNSRSKDNTLEIANDELGDFIFTTTMEGLQDAYEAGYNNFYIVLNKTADNFFTTEEAVDDILLEEASEGYITLGDAVHLKKYGVNFIIKSKNIIEIRDMIKKIPGLHDNIYLEIDNIDDYMKVANESNGYKIIYSGNDISKDELISLSINNSDMLFLNIDIDELSSRNYNYGDGKNKIIDIANLKLISKRPFVKENLEKIIMRQGEFENKRALYNYDKPEPVVLDFKYDEETKRVKMSFKNGKAFNEGDLKELLERNKDIVVGINAPEFTVETLRVIAEVHPDMDRIIPILYSEYSVSSINRMGYTEFVYNTNYSERKLDEIIKLWGGNKMEK